MVSRSSGRAAWFALALLAAALGADVLASRSGTAGRALLQAVPPLRLPALGESLSTPAPAPTPARSAAPPPARAFTVDDEIASSARTVAERAALEGALRSSPQAWTWTDTALQATVGLTFLADYLQTRQIVAKGREANPIMGRRGERLSPHVYFPVVFAASTVAAVLLPREWRRVLQGSLIGLQATTVYRNVLAGDRVSPRG